MIQSMTGYGKATAELSDKKINIEIKSLNSKAMDLSARIAPLYREKEMEIRNEISKMLERGKVDFSLWIEKKDAEQLATPINQELVEAYYKRIKEISAAAGIPEPADWFATLLRMPDVMTKNETQELSDEEWAVVHAAVEEAINHLIDFRKQEGAALEKKFREKIENIARLLESVAPYEQERVGKVKDRITDALEKTLSVDYDKNRLEQELIYYIEKLDINEEKQRLSNHLKYFISTLESGSGQVRLQDHNGDLCARTEYIPATRMTFRQTCGFRHTLKRKDRMKSAKLTLMKTLAIFFQNIKFCKAQNWVNFRNILYLSHILRWGISPVLAAKPYFRGNT